MTIQMNSFWQYFGRVLFFFVGFEKKVKFGIFLEFILWLLLGVKVLNCNVHCSFLSSLVISVVLDSFT